MSLTQYLNTVPFSLTGIQNANTINGNQPVDSITILGQTSYLSSSAVDVNGNVNLDLHIPNGSSSVVGLNYDLTQTNNVFYGTQDFSNTNLKMTLNSADTGYHIGYDPLTRELTYNHDGSSNILGANNEWTGTNFFLNDFKIIKSGIEMFSVLDTTDINMRLGTLSNTGYTVQYDDMFKRLCYIPNDDVYADIFTKNNDWLNINSFQAVNIKQYFALNFNDEMDIKVRGTPRIYSSALGSQITISGDFYLPQISQVDTSYVVLYNASNGRITYNSYQPYINLLPLNNTWTGSNQFNGDVNINGNNLYINNLTDYYSLGRTPFQLTYPVLTSPNKTYYLTSQDQNYFSKIPIDFNNANYSFDTTTKISYMSNGFIYSSNGITGNRTIYLPTSVSVANYYGKAFTGVFYIQRPNQAGTSSILIDRISSDPQTRYSVNGVNQTSFPITLSYETSYTITFSLVSLLTPTSGIWDLYYDIKADGQTSIPTLQFVLNQGNTSVGKNLDLTNGILLASAIETDSIFGNTGTTITTISDIVFNATYGINYSGEVKIQKLGTNIISTSGTNLTIGSTTNTINGTNTISGQSTFQAQVNIDNSKSLNFIDDIEIERNGVMFIDTTDATYLNIRKPLRLYNSTLATKSNILYFDTTTNEITYGAAGAVGGGTTFGSYLMCDGTNFVEQSSTTYPNVLIGRNAGRSSLGRIGMAKTGGGSVFDNIMIGNEILSGSTATTGNWAIGLGTQAFRDGAGRASIGIGLYAGTDLTGTINPDNSIVINASESAILGIGGATIIAPVRNQFNDYQARYSSTTGELSYYPVSSYLIQNTASALTNNTNAQNAFTSPFSSFNAVVGTYKVEWVWACQGMTASSRTMRALWGGTATYNLVRMYYTADTNTAITNFAGDGSTLQQVATAVDVASASTNPSNRLNGNGIIRITGAGTIIPQIQFITAAPTNGVRMTGSYIIFTLLNTSNANSFGDWS